MRVHLIDGTYELFRTFFGAPSATASDGREVGATRGLALRLLKHARVEALTHAGVAFDHVIESFRNELFAGYKTGEGLPPELTGQFGLAEEISRALGFVVWPMVEFEADDALAAAAARFAPDPRVTQVRILSPDKDLAQCVTGERVITVFGERVLDEAGVREHYGVAPRSIPDFLALVGDTADGIPGLPGFGERSASTLLARYEHLESIPEDHRAWDVTVRGAARLAEVLRAEREAALFYRVLATLRTDVPLTETLDDLERRKPDPAALHALADVLGEELVERAQQPVQQPSPADVRARPPSISTPPERRPGVD